MNSSHYRTLGRTNLSVSPIALGTVELGMDYGIPVPGHYGRPSSSAAEQLVGAALDAGINFIDTAQAYGNSEAILGRALRGRRHRAVLATKATVQADGKTLRGNSLRRAMLAGLESSLHSLQTDYVDIWQIHNVDADLLDQADLVAEDLLRSARQRNGALARRLFLRPRPPARRTRIGAVRHRSGNLFALRPAPG